MWKNNIENLEKVDLQSEGLTANHTANQQNKLRIDDNSLINNDLEGKRIWISAITTANRLTRKMHLRNHFKVCSL
jgi:hypothetical protein